MGKWPALQGSCRRVAGGAARARRAGGFTLLELSVVALLLTLAAAWLAGRWQNQVEDAGAEATANYLMMVRGATQALMVHYFEPLLGYAAGPAPALPVFLQGAWPQQFGVAELQQALADGEPGFLAPGFPAVPPLGEAVRVRLWREGTCPGSGCRLLAVVHTVAPLRSGQADYSPALVGALMLATAGFGAHAPPNAPERLRGALLDIVNPMGPVVGIVAVNASLEATHFHQFVRQGDARPIWLQNRLSVQGEVATATGLTLDTEVAVGGPCNLPRGYARTASGTLASCLSGAWFELDRYVVQGMTAALREGDIVPAAQCPPPAQPFVHLALMQLDVQVSGSQIQVQGNVTGAFSGSGSADPAGQVAVSGSFSGSLSSGAASRLQVNQGVSLQAGQVRFSDAGPQARAYAVYGCVHG